MTLAFAIVLSVIVLGLVLATVIQYRKWRIRYEEGLQRRDVEKLARANFAAGKVPDLEKAEIKRGLDSISQLNKKIEDMS